MKRVNTREETTLPTRVDVHCCACEYDHFTLRLTIQHTTGTYTASATLNCAKCGKAVPGIYVDFQLNRREEV